MRRTANMLETELRQERLDGKLLEEMERQMENGIAGDARSSSLRTPVDALRESTLIARPELYKDSVRACARLKDAIEGILSKLE